MNSIKVKFSIFSKECKISIFGVCLKRREFIKYTSLSLAGASTFSLENCNNSQIKGRIVGENYQFAHQFRDNKIQAKNIKTDNKLYSCIILGAGVSGLASAWKFNQLGVKDYLLLEKNEQPGGTSISGEYQEMKFPWAAHYIETPPSEAKELLPLYEDSGIIMGYQDNGWPIMNSEFTVKDPEVLLYTNSNKKWLDSRYPFNIASKRDIQEYTLFFKKIENFINQKNSDGRNSFTLPISLSSEDKSLRGLDRLTMIEWLKKENLTSQLLIWYIDMQCRDNFAVNINEISAWLALNYFSTNYRHDTDELDKPVDVITWPEGNQYLVKAMSKNIGSESIRNNSFVLNIENKNNYVEVLYFDIAKKEFVKVKGKSAIFALPKFLLPRLSNEAKSKNHFLQDFSYAPWITANILLKHLPTNKLESWDNIYYKAYTDPKNWSLGYVNASYQDRKIRKRQKEPLFITFYAPLIHTSVNEERNKLLNQNWDYWSRRIIADLQIMHPNIEEIIERIDIMKWGHAMIQGKRNFIWGKPRLEIKKPIGKIAMGHCDVGGIPIFEQAFYSGIDAVEDVKKWII